MQLHWIDITIILIYLVAVLGVGLAQAWKVRTTGDYYAGGRKFNKFYLMMHSLGTASHADEPVAVIGGAYQQGFSGIWYTFQYLPQTPLFWLISPFYRRSRFITTADFFPARYNRSLGILYAVMGVLKMSVSIGLYLKSAALIAKAASNGQISEHGAIFAMTVVFVIYGFAGGLRATVVTETLQGPLIILMSLLIVPFGLHAVGGFSGLHHSFRPEFFNLTSSGGKSSEFTLGWLCTLSLVSFVGFIAQPGLVAAMGSGKTELEGRVGYTYGTMIKRICALGWVMTGVLVAAMAVQGHLSATQNAELKGSREMAFGIGIQSLLPHGLMGLMFAAIFASQMATLSGLMVNASALAARNLYRGVFRPKASDREVLWTGRLTGLLLVAIGVFLALKLQRVATALTMLLGFASIMGVVMWGGVLWRRANAFGAWAAIVVLFVVWSSLGPPGMLLKSTIGAHHFPAWVGRYGDEKYLVHLAGCYLPAGVATLIVVSLLTRPQPKKQLDDFFLLIKTPVGEEQKLIDAGVPIVYSGSHTPSKWEIQYPRWVHWGGAAIAAVISLGMLGLLYLLTAIGK